jgi:hypothetical protein
MGKKEVKKREAKVGRKQCMNRYTLFKAFVEKLPNTYTVYTFMTPIVYRLNGIIFLRSTASAFLLD